MENRFNVSYLETVTDTSMGSMEAEYNETIPGLSIGVMTFDLG